MWVAVRGVLDTGEIANQSDDSLMRVKNNPGMNMFTWLVPRDLT